MSALHIEQADQPARLAAFLCNDERAFGYGHGPIAIDTPDFACPRHQRMAADLFVAVRLTGVYEAAMFAHHHVWRYDGADGPYYVYHCDAHDPPALRRIWQTEADNR